MSDPASLPRELFRTFIGLLSREEVAHASSISKTWRDFIEGDPTLFREVNLKRFPSRPGEEEISEEEMAEKVIDHLARFSYLSEWTIRKAHVDMTLLAGGRQNVAITWEGSSLPSRVFGELFMSSKFLKIFELTLPPVGLKHPEVLPTVAEQVNAFIRFTEEHLPNCNNLTIRASTYLDLVAKSESKVMRVYHHQYEEAEEEDYFEGINEERLTPERDEQIFPKDFHLILEMKRWTGGDIIKVETEDCRTYSMVTLGCLALDHTNTSRSLNSVLELRFNLYNIFEPQEWFEVLAVCNPNIERLQINDGSFRTQLLEIDLTQLSEEDQVVSNLKELNLLCERSAKMRWEDRFTRWIGNQLETLDIAWFGGFGEIYPVKLGSFITFLRACSSTLWHIKLVGKALAPMPADLDLEGLSLPKLKNLILKTNLETVKFFTKVGLPALRDLEVEIIQKEGNQKRQLPHEDIIEIFRSSTNQTLSRVTLIDCPRGEEEIESELTIVPDLLEGLYLKPLSLGICSLRLSINAEALEMIYAAVEFPKLSELTLDLKLTNHPGNRRLPHEAILKVLRSCSQTLRSLYIYDQSDPWKQNHNSILIFEEESQTSLGQPQPEFSMSKLTQLTLRLKRQESIMVYSSLDYPLLKYSCLSIFSFEDLRNRFLRPENRAASRGGDESGVEC